MAHAIWSGAINFGLVTIPVKLFTAVRENELRFHFLHDKDEGRINNVRMCSVCGKRVDWDHIERGYEYQKGRYVILSDEDFKRADVEATQSVDICEFVDVAEVDPILFDKPYYLEPEKKGRHAYGLLRGALEKSGLVGVARVVIRSREHIALVKPEREALVLELLHFPHEIVPRSEYNFPAMNERAPAGEMKAATTLIDTMKGSFEPASFHDRYRDELLALIKARAHGRKPAPPTAKPRRPAAEVVDLVDVLRRSVAQTKRLRRPARGRARAGARKAA